MPQSPNSIKPFFINTDTDISEVKSNEGMFLKGVIWDIDGNPNTGAGTNNPTGEGQNLLAISTTRSNERVPAAQLPQVGWNKHVGAFESTTTHDMFHFNFNSLGNHGIYVLSGDTDVWQTVIIDPELNFSDEPEAFMANHRCSLRFVRDADGNITEKHLLITDGQSWHKWVNVIAAIKTNGFNVSQFPYWTLQPPHFDRRELLEWAVRPPMIKPIVSVIPNTAADTGKIGQLADKAFQVAIGYLNTDSRYSNFSPYSLPLIVKSADYQNNTDNIPKNAKFILAAGSPLTEKMYVFIRKAEWDKNTFSNGSIIEWSDWYLYDTIDKFTSSGNNSSGVIGNDYWLRTGQWTNHNYDPVFNTIEYNFDNSRILGITNQTFANMIESGMPQLSYAMTDVGDAVMLGDNRYGYPNFEGDVLDKLDIVVAEKPKEGCDVPMRDMYFYAYIGRCGDEFSYTSQVGYYLGTDTKIRFGGLKVTNISSSGADVTIMTDESNSFQLDFADKNGLQLYLKGTPYSAVGEWYYITQGNTLVKLDSLYDFSKRDVVDSAGGILAAGGMFVQRFKLTVPAGKYIATIGRHNVPLSGDYRNTSTWIYGIANSKLKSFDHTFLTLKPSSIKSYSKEMEVDCTNGNVDVFGNNFDMFYIYCPYIPIKGNGAYRFIEGYLQEKPTTVIPVEKFPYQMTHAATDDSGQFTDKNGFYWAYTKVKNAGVVDIQFFAKLNCLFTNFMVTTQAGGIGYRQNLTVYLETFTGLPLGGCNRVVYTGRITDLSGTINYSNIAVSIKDGNTVLTNRYGQFTLIVHNGMSTLRRDSVYINAAGNFLITTAGCGQVPLYYFDESLVPCINCSDRIYPQQINLGVKIDYVHQTSVKEGSKYSGAIYGIDYAGRVMFVNEIKDILVPSFLSRNNTNATYFRMLINGALQLNRYKDIKWVIPCFSKNLTQRRYLDWIGDSIDYIDSNGNVVADSASAVFCAIYITSLYNYNVSNNFSVLSNYQFVQGDRLRVYNDGENQLFDVATYGDPVDIEIYGTSFNQAIINAGLVPPPTNTVFNATTSNANLAKSVTLIVQYDSRLDKLAKKTGFWIETYTPTKERDVIPYQDANGAYPVINGEIAEYTGGGYANPQYNYPVSIDIDFYDTYLFQRNITIPNIGSKYFNHIFQSVNITDSFGKEITSGGRRNVKNKLAQQLWFGADTIKSDDFVKEGVINGLSFFSNESRKNFSTYPFGSIVAMKSERNIIGIYCENDWFLVDYNYHFTYANEQGVMVTNLNDGLSTPHQKVNGKYGLSKKDTGTFVVSEVGVFWLDNKNTGFIRMDYRNAVDVSQLTEEAGEKGGLQSYLNSKLSFINEWNNSNPKESWWDTICGIDAERGNVFLTFRNRRHNSNDMSSYINNRRDIDLRASETVVYSIQYHAWLRFEGFAPEGYCRLRGAMANVEMYSFAAGVPYRHNNTSNESYLNFFGIQTEPVIKAVFNEAKDIVKLFQSFAHDSNPNGWFIDLMYTNFMNSFTYLSDNQFRKKEGQWYAAIKRNMNSYPSNDPADLFRSMLVDGYRIFGRYLVFRMVGKHSKLNKYNQVNNIYIKMAASGNNTK